MASFLVKTINSRFLLREADCATAMYRIDELIKRRSKLQQVYTRVRQDRLDSFFEMIIARRHFLLARQAQRRDEIGGVPAIQVDADDGSESDRESRTSNGKRRKPDRGGTRGRSESFVEHEL